MLRTTIAALAEKYRDVPIDVLLNNAAINAYRFGLSRFGKIDYDWFEEILRVNIIGPLKVSEAFQANVEASKQKKIIAMTSTGGSITNQTVPINIGYSTSKSGRLAPRSAINDMIGLIDRLTIEDSGVYYKWDGEVLPW